MANHDDLADYLREHVDSRIQVTSRDPKRGFYSFSLRSSQVDLTTLTSSVDAFYDAQGFSFCPEASGQVKRIFFSRWYKHMSGSRQNILSAVNGKNISFFVTTEETPHQKEVREYINKHTKSN